MSDPSIPLFDPRPVTLTGDHVRLEPMNVEHADDLFAAGDDSDIWAFMPRAPFRDRADCQAWVDTTVDSMRSGAEIVFTIVHVASGRAAGSTRILDVQPANRGLEIGWTWLGKEYQRTAVNTECKLLLLEYAFDKLGAVRVQLKTDGRNEASQHAIARLGAVREGTLRKHRATWDGIYRDTVYYSILDDEWSGVRENLRRRLGR